MPVPPRSDVFLRQDVAAILRSIATTALVMPRGNSPHDAAFVRGFYAALYAVATALHIPSQLIDPRETAPHDHDLEIKRTI